MHRSGSAGRGPKQGRHRPYKAVGILGASHFPHVVPPEQPRVFGAAPRQKIRPSEIGLKQVGDGWAGTARVEVMMGHGATRGFSREVRIFFGLRSGFVLKHSVKVNGVPVAVTEKTLRQLDVSLAHAQPVGGKIVLSAPKELAECLLGRKF